jgi:hypothetical protein
VGWRKVARLLRPAGLLVLVMHISFLNEETAELDGALHDVFERHLPADGIWRPLRDLETLRAGFEERRNDISAVWTWLGHHDLTDPSAAELFRDVRLTTTTVVRELTPERLWALFETTSAYARIDDGVRAALERDMRETFELFGGAGRSSDLAVLVTGRTAG